MTPDATAQLAELGRAAAMADLAAHAMRQIWADALVTLRTGLQHLAASTRQADETARLTARLARATPPPAMAAAPVAPARGAMLLVPNVVATAGGIRHVEGSHWQGMDRMSAMNAQALLRHRADCQRAGTDAPFRPLFTAGQIAMGRYYAAMVERHEAGGIRCASIEARADGSGNGDGRGITDARLDEARRIDAIRRRIGTGIAMSVRRIRPSTRGATARPITDRTLVDMVCLHDMDLSDVLRRHGWAVNGKHRAALRMALVAALDRAQGYGASSTQSPN